MEEAAFAISVMFMAREMCIGYSILVLLFETTCIEESVY
jgi:hypothetical protein